MKRTLPNHDFDEVFFRNEVEFGSGTPWKAKYRRATLGVLNSTRKEETRTLETSYTGITYCVGIKDGVCYAGESFCNTRIPVTRMRLVEVYKPVLVPVKVPDDIRSKYPDAPPERTKLGYASAGKMFVEETIGYRPEAYSRFEGKRVALEKAKEAYNRAKTGSGGIEEVCVYVNGTSYTCWANSM
jgi:hypothetical protein